MRNEELYNLGKKIRREVVGDEYDDEIQNKETDFSQPIRDWTTENVWGTVWADNTLSRKTRSLLNVALTTALRCSHEMKVHIRGARNKRLYQGGDSGGADAGSGIRRRVGSARSGSNGESSLRRGGTETLARLYR